MSLFPKFDLSGIGLSKLDLSKIDLSKIDMGEVTRLTRAGRLGEALAVLRGQGGAAPGGGDRGEGPGRSPAGGEALPRSPRVADGAGQPSHAHARGGLFGTLDAAGQSLSERLGALPGFDALRGLGDPSRGRPNPPATPPGARFEQRLFSNAAGSRAYKIFVPGSHGARALPVVVMLHGCNQSPDDFAAGTGMNALAEEEGFLVVYPAQSPGANPQRCWNWFKPHDQARETGEPSLVAGIARQVIDEFGADASRVYVAGLSAGGAAAAIMGATHPDLFAAVGVHSGLACGAARDLPSALAAMQGAAPSQPAAAEPGVPTIVFHGDADRTVHPVNGDRVIARAAPGEAPAQTVEHGRSPGGIAYTRTVRSDRAGRPLAEHWVLHEAGHAWSGGRPEGSYTEPRGPDASREMLRFFRAHRLPARA